MGANVSAAACCNKEDKPGIPSETIRAAGADAENPLAADPDTKASEESEVVAVDEVDEAAGTATHRLKVMKSLGHLEVRFRTKPSCVRYFGAFEGDD